MSVQSMMLYVVKHITYSTSHKTCCCTISVLAQHINFVHSTTIYIAFTQQNIHVDLGNQQHLAIYNL